MPSPSGKRQFELLARSATNCRECFTLGEVSEPDINVAQPRWIGPGYWTSPSRVAIVMLNPGQSGATPQAREYLVRIRAFRDGEMSLQPILDRQRESMNSWGSSPGRFTDFYLAGLGLELDEIAFANVAWCGTKGNKYPRSMLNRCFSRHTGPLLELLRPAVVLLSGRATHCFASSIGRLLPRSRVITMLHYAHREGHAAELAESKRVRALIAAAKADLAGSPRPSPNPLTE